MKKQLASVEMGVDSFTPPKTSYISFSTMDITWLGTDSDVLVKNCTFKGAILSGDGGANIP